ncbi:molybdenum ABC transporter ATP-binding protein ModC [Vibrio sp. CAIM 722]|uniref:Molybdenum ABC transporter ATP-binding protein ModC n=1 Tax=Vibrio eleionomae TaxID=2653505 RepID=A0A7X4LMW2_9VIBR|nr:molybdenum ABC transporter ATP-binding protein ModC [Vibrio eleionomae]MZI94557.1 molybdenum ABC transporter ATP-binding protein ModC [Vibrio eleionomae]
MSELNIQFHKQLGDTVFDIDIQLPNRGISAIFGRSGAGKTSLINVISGLVGPDSGEIQVKDRWLFSTSRRVNLPIEQRRVGYVFQESRLFPHYTVKSNLNYGVKHQDPKYFESIVELLAIKPLLDRYPNALSGGEKQRVAIGRALLSQPDILLMDEPLASLDLPRKREVMPFLEQLADTVNIPILYVTHSLDEILRLADYLVLIENGKVVNAGNVEAVWSSETMRPWHDMSEHSTLFAGEIHRQHENYTLTELRLAPNVPLWVQQVQGESGTAIRLQIRANDVSIVTEKPEQTSIRNILPATIQQIEHRMQPEGTRHVDIKLELAPDCFLWATITEWALDDLQLSVGQAVYAQIKGVSITQQDVAVTR